MEPLGALAFFNPLTMGQIPPATAVVDAYVEAFNARDIETMRELRGCAGQHAGWSRDRG